MKNFNALSTQARNHTASIDDAGSSQIASEHELISDDESTSSLAD